MGFVESEARARLLDMELAEHHQMPVGAQRQAYGAAQRPRQLVEPGEEVGGVAVDDGRDAAQPRDEQRYGLADDAATP